MGAAGMADEVADVAASVAADSTKPKKAYKCPPLSLLQHGKRGGGESDAHLRETAMKLQQTLENFGVNVTITNVAVVRLSPDMNYSRKWVLRSARSSDLPMISS